MAIRSLLLITTCATLMFVSDTKPGMWTLLFALRLLIKDIGVFPKWNRNSLNSGNSGIGKSLKHELG